MPKLRFPGFSGEWKVNRLGDVGVTYPGLAGKSATDFGDGSNYITYMQIFSSSKIDAKAFAKVKVSAGERQNKVQQGDIFFTTSSETPEEVGYTSVLLENVENTYLNSFCFGYRADKSAIFPEFARFLFHNPNVRREITKLAQGSTRFNLSKNALMKMQVNMPITAEQEKIAEFLTLVDERVAVVEQKAEFLRKYKKGVMQKIFTQRLRFKDQNGQNYSTWQTIKLGEIMEIGSSKRVLQKDWQASGIPFYRTREVINLAKGQPFRTPIFISLVLYNELSAKYGAPKPGDLLTSGVGSIGSIYLVEGDNKFYFKDGNVLWLKQSEHLDSRYLYQIFQARFVQKQIEENASITTVATFTIEGAKKTKILYPCLEEQQKIAGYLTSLDDKIKLTEEQLTQAKTYKKSLLQRMFV